MTLWQQFQRVACGALVFGAKICLMYLSQIAFSRYRLCQAAFFSGPLLLE